MLSFGGTLSSSTTTVRFATLSCVLVFNLCLDGEEFEYLVSGVGC